jgi:pimeloyl-ACP methyl ester carboxylesterase
MAAWRFSPIQHIPLTVEVESSEEGRSFVWQGKLAGVLGRHGFELGDASAESDARVGEHWGAGSARCEVVQWEELHGAGTYVIQLAGVWSNLRRAFSVLLRQLRSHLARQQASSPLRELEVDGATFRYLDTGNGTPVVMLHGYPQNHDCWRHQVTALKGTYRIIVPDLLGWGASDRPLDLDYDYEAEVDRLVRFIEGLGVAPVHLVAHDYGAYLALGVARRRPDLLRSLAVMNTRAHRTFKRRWKLVFVPALRWLSQAPVVGRWSFWLPVSAAHRFFLRAEIRDGVFDRAAVRSYLGHLGAGSEGTRWLLRFFAPGRGYSFVPRPALRTGHDPALRTLVIWGTTDTFLPVRIAHELAESLPNCTLKLLPGVGHYVMEEAPDEVSAALRRFLDASRATDGVHA